MIEIWINCLILSFLQATEDYIFYSYQSFWSCDFSILDLLLVHEKEYAIYSLFFFLPFKLLFLICF